MDPNPDFRDLLQCLNDAKTRFLIVGGYALILHTEPRFTKDLDVWVEPTAANAARTWRALSLFGAPLVGVSMSDFATPGTYYLVGVPPNRVDIITAIDGVEFAAAWKRRAKSGYAGQEVGFLSLADLIRNKRAVGRPQDLIDVRKLESVQRSRRKRRGAKP